MFRVTKECKMVTNYMIEVINKCNEFKRSDEKTLIDNIRLRKLLYFCEALYMKNHNGMPMLPDFFLAWPSGPFIPYDLKRDAIEANEVSISDDIKNVVDVVVDLTKDIDTLALINMSMALNGLWWKVRNANDYNYDLIISKEEMSDYYLNNEIFDNSVIDEKIIGNVRVR